MARCSRQRGPTCLIALLLTARSTRAQADTSSRASVSIVTGSARMTTIFVTPPASLATAVASPTAAAIASSDTQLTTIALICTSVAVVLLLSTALGYRWTVIKRRRRRAAALAGTTITLPAPKMGASEPRSYSSTAGGRSDKSAATLAWLEGTKYAAPPIDPDDPDDGMSSRPSWIGSQVSRDWRRLAKRAQRGSMLSAPSFVAKASDASPGSKSRSSRRTGSSASKRQTGSSTSPRSRRFTGLSFLGALRDADGDKIPPVPALNLADIGLHEIQLDRVKAEETHDDEARGDD